MTFNDFSTKVRRSQWGDNFSDKSIHLLYEHMRETETTTEDIGAIAQAYRELLISDIQGHDVDFRDYCTAYEPGEVEEFYEYVTPEFWPIFLRWVADNTDDFADVISYSLTELASTKPHGIEVLKYIDDKSVLINADYFDGTAYCDAIAAWYCKDHTIIGDRPAWLTEDVVILTTND
jgi:hypothetical protein